MGMQIQTHIRVWREGRQFIAHALPLDVASSGPDETAARSALRDAIELFIDSARAMGTLDEILDECGYTLTDGTWRAPTILSQESDLLAV